MHPSGGVDRFGGLLGGIPVAEHDRVTPGAQLTWCAPGHRELRHRVDDLHLDVWHHGPDRRDTALEIIGRRVIVDTGDVSVMPYMIVTSDMFISTTHCFMTSTGHGDPAMIPVRNDERS